MTITLTLIYIQLHTIKLQLLIYMYVFNDNALVSRVKQYFLIVMMTDLNVNGCLRHRQRDYHLFKTIIVLIMPRT